MDRYDRIMRDILDGTDADTLKWSVVSPGHYIEQLIHKGRILRAFRADYPLGEQPYQLLFVERRVQDTDPGRTLANSAYELYILDQFGEVVLPLYDGVVERDDLLRLAGLLFELNDKAKGFFAAFDQARPS